MWRQEFQQEFQQETQKEHHHAYQHNGGQMMKVLRKMLKEWDELEGIERINKGIEIGRYVATMNPLTLKRAISKMNRKELGLMMARAPNQEIYLYASLRQLKMKKNKQGS